MNTYNITILVISELFIQVNRWHKQKKIEINPVIVDESKEGANHTRVQSSHLLRQRDEAWRKKNLKLIRIHCNDAYCWSLYYVGDLDCKTLQRRSINWVFGQKSHQVFRFFFKIQILLKNQIHWANHCVILLKKWENKIWSVWNRIYGFPTCTRDAIILQLLQYWVN